MISGLEAGRGGQGGKQARGMEVAFWDGRERPYLVPVVQAGGFFKVGKADSDQ